MEKKYDTGDDKGRGIQGRREEHMMMMVMIGRREGTRGREKKRRK